MAFPEDSWEWKIEIDVADDPYPPVWPQGQGSGPTHDWSEVKTVSTANTHHDTVDWNPSSTGIKSEAGSHHDTVDWNPSATGIKSEAGSHHDTVDWNPSSTGIKSEAGSHHDTVDWNPSTTGIKSEAGSHHDTVDWNPSTTGIKSEAGSHHDTVDWNPSATGIKSEAGSHHDTVDWNPSSTGIKSEADSHHDAVDGNPSATGIKSEAGSHHDAVDGNPSATGIKSEADSHHDTLDWNPSATGIKSEADSHHDTLDWNRSATGIKSEADSHHDTLVWKPSATGIKSEADSHHDTVDWNPSVTGIKSEADRRTHSGQGIQAEPEDLNVTWDERHQFQPGDCKEENTHMKRRSCICGDISTKPVDFWNAVNSNLCELVPRFDTSKVKVEPSTVSVEVNSDWTDSDLKSEPVTTDAGKTEVVTTDNSSDVIKTEPITADINSDVIKTEPFTADINSDVIKTEPITADINSDVIRTEAVTTNTSAPESTASRQESMDTCVGKKQKHNKVSPITHQASGSGQKPLTCDVCNETFRQPSDLTTHKVVHSHQRLFTCDTCGETFPQASALNDHKKLHSGQPQRPYTCDVCSKVFTSAVCLEEHKRIHSSQGPFSCDMCNESFALIGHLKHHKLIHTGQRPHACDMLDKTFNVTHVQVQKHGGYKTLLRTLQLDYAGVPREVAMKFVGLCSVCQNDTAQRTRAAKATEALRERVAKVPCTTQAFNVRCQVDVMSMGQNIDGRYSHIGLYLDHWTHFLTLFPMSGCAAQHVAYGLASSVLPYFGPPRFLHSPEGKEFATQVIEHSMDTWKGAEKMTMPQGKAGLENLGQAMEEMQARLTQEIKDRAKEDSLQLPLPWASWLGKIMFDINNKRDETTGRSPYSRVFERSIGMSEAGEPTEPIRDVAYKVAYSQIDWHDFVVVETVDFQQNETGTLPPPTTPEEVGARILNQERYERGEIAIDDAVEMEVESDEEEAEEEEEEEEDSEEEEGPIVPPLPPPPKPAQPPEEKEPQDMEEDSDEEDRPPLPPPPPRPKVAPPPAPPPPPPPPPTEAPPLPPTPDQVVIRRDYNPKEELLRSWYPI